MATELTQSRPASSDRDSFLDALRAIAILRVVVWHTYGAAWISYLVASLPVMFFVAGSLMALSLGRGNALDVLYRRFRRLLPPLWVMGIVAIAVMAAYDQLNDTFASRLPWSHVVWWLFPIWDPTGSDWGITWWAPLWYLRCLTWLMLASPLLLPLWRRFGPVLLLVPLAGITFCELRLQDGHSVAWQLQDAALYSLFWLLGFAYNDGSLKRLPRVTNLLLAAACGITAAAWGVTQDVPANIVNASYPLHMLVALTWLFGFLALRQPIARLALRPRIDGVIYWVNERALTIYLWHAAGLFCMYQLLWSKPHSALARNLEALPIVASVTFLAVLLVGWIEDVAAGRSPRLWPVRRTTGRRVQHRLLSFGLPVGAVALAGCLALFAGALGVVDQPSTLVQPSSETVPASGAGLRLRTERAQITRGTPPPRGTATPMAEATKQPSQAEPEATKSPDTPEATTEPAETPTTPQGAESKPDTPAETIVTGTDLQAILDAWSEKWQFGLTISLERGESGELWTGCVGYHEDGSPFANDEHYWIGSVTKTFTVALVMRLVEQGLLSLDDPVSNFVPEFPESDRFTVRQLIQHTSGLIVGDETPYEALVAAAQQGLQFEPGTSFLYSRAGYYMLGLIIEERLGKSYTSVVREQLIEPVELWKTVMDEEVQPLRQSTHPYAPLLEGLPGVTWTSGGLFRERSADVDYHGIHWSSGGLFSTTSDLARWAYALWGTDRVVSPESLDAMTTFLGPEFDLTGLGTFPACPCWLDGDRLQAERWGHLGATGSIEYDPTDRVSLAMHISGSVTDENVLEALDEISSTLRGAIRGRTLDLETVGSSALAQADDQHPSGPIARTCAEIAGRSYSNEYERLYFLATCPGVVEPALLAPEVAEAGDGSDATPASDATQTDSDDGACDGCETPVPGATPSPCAGSGRTSSACTCLASGADGVSTVTDPDLCPRVAPPEVTGGSNAISLEEDEDAADIALRPTPEPSDNDGPSAQ